MSTPNSTVPNPLNWLFEFLGSANVQKIAGLAGGPAVAAYATGLPDWARGFLVIAGPTFAAFVHSVDAYRAKIGR